MLVARFSAVYGKSLFDKDVMIPNLGIEEYNSCQLS